MNSVSHPEETVLGSDKNQIGPGHCGEKDGAPGQIVTIIVNGREKSWHKGEISYEEVVALSAVPLPDGPDPGFTITYRNAHGDKPEGTLTPGKSVKVKDGMIFNVTPTNRS